MTGNRILENMAIIFMACMVGIILSGAATAVIAPHEEWNKTFGGIGYTDWARSVQQTSDGGYILAGYTDSFGAGAYDAWLIKTNSSGSEQWNRTYGGGDSEMAYSVKQISDGGYILAGYVSVPTTGVVSALLIKTDSSGNKLWSKTFGSIGESYANSVQQTSDGGYILAGYTRSSGAGGYDFWLIKTDASGNERWSKTYGGISQDYAYSVQQTSDGGFVLAGFTSSFGAGYNDAWLVKTDLFGNEEWNKTFGGINDDFVYSVQQTSDGGFVLGGFTGSFGASMNDAWLVKTDSIGNEQWNKLFGGYNHDYAYSVQQTSDGGYILGGVTNNYGASYGEAWLIKANSSGNEQWNKIFGGASFDQAFSVQQTSDNGYVLAGFTRSFGVNPDSAWLIKVSNKTLTPQVIIPYLDSGYKYKVVTFNEGAGFEQPSFDDSGFLLGNAGFGSLTACSLNNPTYVKTSWPLNSDMLLRKEFNLPSGATNVRVGVAIDNDVQVFINGIDVSGGLISHDFCPARDSLIFTIPDNVLTTGSNLLAVRARGRGDQDYIDVQVTADVPILPLTATIELPTNNFYSEELVNFKGTASGGTPPYTYTWLSTKEGTFRTITTASTVDEFNYNLILKEHDIILTVQDSAGGIQSQLITLHVVLHSNDLNVIPVNYETYNPGSEPVDDIPKTDLEVKSAAVKDFYLKSSYNSQYLDFKPPLDTVILPGSQASYENFETKEVFGKQKNIMNVVDDILTNNPIYSGIGEGTVVIVLNNRQTNMAPVAWIKREGRQFILVYRDSNYGIWAHEAGHLFGLKDFYYADKPEDHGVVYWWDIMGDGPYVSVGNTPDIIYPVQHSSFNKLILGWLKSSEVSYQEISLTPLEEGHFEDPVYVFRSKVDNSVSFIVEARDLPSGNHFVDSVYPVDGTLEDGVVIYKVENYDLLGTMKPIDKDKNWKINSLSSIGWTGFRLDWKRDDPTLSTEQMEYTDYSHFVTFGITSVSTIPYYQSTVRISPCGGLCKLYKGVKMGITSTIGFITGSPFLTDNSTAPDLDLHAVTPEGLHIGMNYTSGEYEMQIPGGVSSGDLIGGEEWIFVPVGTQVRYYVDSRDVQQYLEENPDIDPANATMNYSITSMEYGENPQSVELPDGNSTVTDRNISVPEAGTIGPGIIVEMNTTPVWKRYINGTVTDSINKTGIVDVTVSANIDISTKTNATGFYSLIVGGGTYNLKVDLEPIYYVNNSVTFSTVESPVSVQDFELLKKPTGNIRGGVTIK